MGVVKRRGEEEEWNRVKMPFWKKTNLNMMNIDQIHFEIRRSTLIKTIKNEIMRLKSLKFESLELSA